MSRLKAALGVGIFVGGFAYRAAVFLPGASLVQAYGLKLVFNNSAKAASAVKFCREWPPVNSVFNLLAAGLDLCGTLSSNTLGKNRFTAGIDRFLQREVKETHLAIERTNPTKTKETQAPPEPPV